MPPNTKVRTRGPLCAITQQPQWNLENAHHDEFTHADAARAIGTDADTGATQTAADRSSHQASVDIGSAQAVVVAQAGASADLT
jgi:hypothetical protein